MKVDLDPETGSREADEAESSHAAADFVYSGPSLSSTAAAQQRVQEVVLAALRGSLPRNRPLQRWEPAKLSARHVSMCCDKASGMSSAEIAEKYRMGTGYVNVILTHPDSLYVIGAIQALNADKLTDINARLQGYAHEMLTKKVEIMRTTADKRLQDSIASDILDRAGYGARRQIDLNASLRFAMPAEQASLVSQALSEDNRVAVVDYRQFTGRKLNDAGALESGAEPSSRLPEQQTVSSASPGTSPEATASQEEAA